MKPQLAYSLSDSSRGATSAAARGLRRAALRGVRGLRGLHCAAGRALSPGLLVLLIGCANLPVNAQAPAVQMPAAWVAQGGERLSALIESKWASPSAPAFEHRPPWGLRWHSGSERRVQAAQLAAQITALQARAKPSPNVGFVGGSGAASGAASGAESGSESDPRPSAPRPGANAKRQAQAWAQQWLNWLQGWQATGRVFLPLQDPRLMQLHPRWDPVLQAGDHVLWHSQAELTPHLSLLSGDAQVCQVPHAPGLRVADVLAHCGLPSLAASEAAWLVQTDGRVLSNAGHAGLPAAPAADAAQHRSGLGPALDKQPKATAPATQALALQMPQPGAWLWLPHRALSAAQPPGPTPSSLQRRAPEGQQPQPAQLADLRAFWPLPQAQQLAQLLAAQGPHLQPPAQWPGAAPATPHLLNGATPPQPRQAAWAPPAMTPSTSTWGSTGAVQTPTARQLPAGSAGFSINRASPYTHFSFLLQPAHWLQTTMRYSRIQGRLYGADIAGDRAYLDKSLEFKISLLDEGPASPAVSLGLRDPLGTGLFEGEYLVASKAFAPTAMGLFDAHLGLGWGYFGAAGSWANPLKALSPRMGTRQGFAVGEGGKARLNSLFTGRVSPFAGVQWQPLGQSWWLKAEWDGNDYRHEPSGEYRFKPRTRLNLGAVWPMGGLNLHLGVERGQVLSLGLSWADDLSRLSYAPARARQAAPELPSLEAVLAQRAQREAAAVQGLGIQAAAVLTLGGVASDEPTNPISVAAAPGSSTETSTEKSNEKATAALPGPVERAVLAEVNAQTGWWAQALRAPVAQRWVLQVERAGGAHLYDRLEAVAELLHAAAGAEVLMFEVVATVMGVEVSRFEIQRAAFVRARNQWLPPSQRVAWLRRADREATSTALGLTRVSGSVGGQLEPQAPGPGLAQMPAEPIRSHAAPQAFVWSVVPGWQHNLGGPDGPLYALSAKVAAHWPLWQGAWAHGQVALRLADNYGNYRYTAPSNLPRVRTYLREYQTEARLTVPNAQVNQLWRLGQGTWALAYAGLLEPAFAGAGAELLHRPAQGWWSNWAFGLDLNAVQQREFAQRLALREYKVLTGHFSAQWNTGWQGMQVFAQAGRYLAGDVGGTLNVSRSFANGLRMGLWATKTRVSSQAFGEGSFDKGVYLSLPMELLTGRPSNGNAMAVWQPLIRDGGARLSKAQSLWGLTPLREPLALQYTNPASVP